jgi:subtilisin family serine protease
MISRVATLLVVVVTAAAPALAADTPTIPPPPDPRTLPSPQAAHPALSPVLNQLYDSYFGSADPLRRAGLRHLVVEESWVEVVAVSRPSAAAAIGDRVRQLGGRVQNTYRDLVFATVPIAELPLLASHPSVLRVRTPYRSQPDVVSEGVAVHHADGLHGQGITGLGVKVGVLDCGGFSGYQVLLGTELPAQISLWTGGADPVGSSVHGTACAEVVHDMAPGAELYFAHDHTEAEFYVAVDWLIAQEVDIISYSCSWTGPFPGDGRGDPYNPVNQKVSDARAAGVLFVTSAGNSADGENYAAWYSLHPSYPNWHSFDGDWGDACDYLHTGDEVDIILTWSDWPADPLTQGSTQDYNMALYYYDGANWQIPAWSSNPQNGQPGQIPVEEIQFTAAATEWHYVVIYDDGTTAPRFLSLRSFDCDFQYSDPDYSVFTPETLDALNVGAVFWNGLGLEPFSSQGPIFAPGGLPDGALAPQIVGVDGTSGVSYGMSNGLPWGGGGTGFFGTSASCPHVAGGAALLLSANPGLTVDQLETLLLAGATDMGAAGPDNQYGYGLMNLEIGPLFADGFESGDTTAWSATTP